jgi:hypothetical protein
LNGITSVDDEDHSPVANTQSWVTDEDVLTFRYATTGKLTPHDPQLEIRLIDRRNRETQKSEIPLPIRLRDNQRRSRERRKEYIEDIKRRLAEYERRGVEASIEVQQAAQKVGRENWVLRELLAERGLPAGELNAILESHGGSVGDASMGLLMGEVKAGSDDIGKGKGRARAVGDWQEMNMRTRMANETETPDDDTSSGTSSAMTSPMVSPSVTQSSLVLPYPEITTISLADLVQGQPQTSASQNKSCGPSACSSTCKPSSSAPANMVSTESGDSSRMLVSNSGLDSSCQDAATLLASVRWHNDRDQALQELGCAPHEDCRVENTKLLERLGADNTNVFD